MRITREMMLKVASDAVARQTRSTRGLLAAYLCGSLLEEDYLLGGTGDIDLVYIYTEPVAAPREIVSLTDVVHLDIAHYFQRDFRDTRSLREHPWLGPALNTCRILYDPQHFMDFTIAGLRGQFDRADHVYQRISQTLESARRILNDLDEIGTCATCGSRTSRSSLPRSVRPAATTQPEVHMLPAWLTRRTGNLLGAFACAGLLGYALFVQYGLGLEPCPLCILQRAAVISAGVLFLAGSVHDPATPAGAPMEC